MMPYLDVMVGVLTLLVLAWTLVVLRQYARDTKRIAWAAVEQLPRPCVVVKRSPDPSDEAVLRDTTASLGDRHGLTFANVGTGPAVNCRYRIEAADEDTEATSRQLPEIGSAEEFESEHPRNALRDSAIVVIEYESLAGSRYRTEATIAERR